MDFKVRSPENYANGFTSQYNLPIEIGCYSINSDGKFCNDNHQMKYLVKPRNPSDMCLDLNDGFSEYINIHEDTEDSFNAVLKWILSHEDLLRQRLTVCNSSDSKIDFVLFRGALTSIASIPYEKSENCLIFATKFRSVIYMVPIKTYFNTERIKDMGEKAERLATWGFKFEQYMTSDAVGSRPDTSVPVNENEKYHCVLKGKLNHHRILIVAEIDGVDPEHFKETGHDPSSVLRYIELKTSRIITSARQYRNFLRYKLIKWYLQSYFGGVPTVICGFRDDDGFVRKLVNYNVRDMPKMAKDMWSSESCLNFCSHFLNHLKKCDMKDDPRIVYSIYWEPSQDSINIEEFETEHRVLPEWYIERVNVL